MVAPGSELVMAECTLQVYMYVRQANGYLHLLQKMTSNYMCISAKRVERRGKKQKINKHKHIGFK